MEILVSTKEAARRISVGKTKLFDLLSTQQLQAVRLGSRTMIPVSELQRFAATLPSRGKLTAASTPKVVGNRQPDRVLPTANDPVKELCHGKT